MTARKTPAATTVNNNAPAIQVGASAEAVNAAREAITSILAARVDNKTMRAALAALSSVCSVNGTTLSGCQINQGSPQ